MERVRIKDIAKMADVSVGTVDRVIHGRSGVSESSRKRVEEILKQPDYQPNMYAVHWLRTKSIHLPACCHCTRKANTGQTWRQAYTTP